MESSWKKTKLEVFRIAWRESTSTYRKALKAIRSAYFPAGLLKVRTPVRIRTGKEFNPDPPPLDISRALVSLRPPCGVRCAWHTHTHTHGRMNQCCSDYRLFCKTKHIATSDILDKSYISFSRIMSPVSPREHEVSPPQRSLSPPAELAAYSKNRTEPNRSRLLNERVQNSVS